MSDPETAEAKRFGAILYNAVFSGSVRDCLARSITATAAENRGLRLRLRLSGVPELNDLPWEFIYNAHINKFLGLSLYTPIVRYLEMPEAPRPLRIVPPLRMLVVIASPEDQAPLDVEAEWQNLNKALQDLTAKGLVQIDRLDGVPQIRELNRQLTKSEYHVLHFIGHGRFNRQADSGELLFEDQHRRGVPVSAETLGILVESHRSLRLVVLNACEGARNSVSDPFSGTAQTLIQQGVPAVIAMQFEITDESAIVFSSEFYASVAVGAPIDQSLAHARRMIYSNQNEIEWATPVLYLRTPDGRIFDVTRTSAVADKQSNIAAASERTAADDYPIPASADPHGSGGLDAVREPDVETELQADEAARLANEQRYLSLQAEQKRQADEAARLANETRVRARLAAEEIQANEVTRLNHEKRLADAARSAAAAKRAEAARVAGVAAKLAEEKRQADAARMAEERRKADEVAAQLAAEQQRQAEAARLAEAQKKSGTRSIIGVPLDRRFVLWSIGLTIIPVISAFTFTKDTSIDLSGVVFFVAFGITWYARSLSWAIRIGFGAVLYWDLVVIVCRTIGGLPT